MTVKAWKCHNSAAFYALDRAGELWLHSKPGDQTPLKVTKAYTPRELDLDVETGEKIRFELSDSLKTVIYPQGDYVTTVDLVLKLRNISYSQIIAIWTAQCVATGIENRMRLLAYHDCCEHPVLNTELGAGPPSPFTCPECGKPVTADDLSYTPALFNYEPTIHRLFQSEAM